MWQVVCATSFNPINLTQPIYDGLLFGASTGFESETENDTNDLFCRTCALQFNTERAFTLHFRGVTHIQRALEGLQRRNPERLDRFSSQQLEYHEESRHHAWLQSQYLEKTRAEFIQQGTLYCELCHVRSSSHVTLQAHLNGRRHRENVILLRSTGDASQLSNKRQTQIKTVARLQTLLDMCTQPLIGLNYVVERQFGDDEECVYFCDLCNERLCRQDAIKHVCSVPHRTNYMKSHYPDMCGIVANDCSTPTVRLKRIEFYARQIEDFEGRKRIKVKQLSAFDALRRIWRPMDEPDVKSLSVMYRETRLTNEASRRPKAIEKAPTKKPVRRKPPDDLEEGEITEDSSDDETGSTVCGMTVARIEPSVSNADQIAKSDDDRCFVEQESYDQISLNALLPRGVMTFRPHSDCEAFIKTLKSSGFLDLGKSADQDVITSSTITNAALPDARLDEEFERETNWVLDRVRARQEAEEESRRQLAASISAASKLQATKSLTQERRMRIQRGLHVMEETRRAFDFNSYDPSVDESIAQKPVATSAPQVIPAPNVQPEEGRTQEKEKSPISEASVMGLLGSMDTSRRRLAVSTGAVEIILSALGALRDAGQLPSYFTTTSQNATTSACTLKSDDTSVIASDTKLKISVPLVTNTSISPIIAKSTTSKALAEKPPNVPSIQVNASRNMGLLASEYIGQFLPSSSSLPVVTQSITVTPVVNSSFPTPVAVHPIDKGELTTKRPSVGLLGDPLPQRAVPNAPIKPSLPMAIRDTSRPAKSVFISKNDICNQSPKPIFKMPAKQIRLNMDYDPTPVPAPEPVSAKVASYMRADVNGGSETMFDAYALYSRRAQQPRQSRFDRIKPSELRVSLRKRPAAVSGSVSSGGVRKLSMIADMLGVNEPPAPRLPVTVSDVHPPNNPSLSEAVSHPALMHPSSEPAYLIPASTFSLSSSSSLPRISYYIPKNQSAPVVLPTSSLNVHTLSANPFASLNLHSVPPSIFSQLR